MKKFIDSVNHSISGIIHAFKTEKNMKIHFGVSLLVIIASILMHVTRFELIAIVISITLVMLAELLNTAVEAIVDLITDEYHELARIAKNVAAGAVTLTAVNALVVGYLVFFRKISSFQLTSLSFFQDLSAHITFASLAIVCVVVITIKSRQNASSQLLGSSCRCFDRCRCDIFDVYIGRGIKILDWSYKLWNI